MFTIFPCVSGSFYDELFLAVPDGVDGVRSSGDVSCPGQCSDELPYPQIHAQVQSRLLGYVMFINLF